MERKLPRIKQNAPIIAQQPSTPRDFDNATGTVQETGVRGKIKFIHRTGYGFVRRDDNNEVVYIPRSELRRNPKFRQEGQAVSFDVEAARIGPRAINLTIPEHQIQPTLVSDRLQDSSDGDLSHAGNVDPLLLQRQN